MDRNNDTTKKKKINPVALRKESVDRNIFLTLTVRNVSMSLSARRAWIEMGFVDPDADALTGRSPQGERG